MSIDNMKYRLIGFVSALCCVLQLSAVVAKPGLIQARQPDGSTVTIKMEGGPRGHNIYTPDDRLLMTDEKGFYVPADDEFRSRIAQKFTKTKAAKLSLPGLMSNPFPSKGKQTSLVILVEFPDCKFSIDNPNDFYEEMLNGEDFTQFDATGSARQYFQENSNGEFDIDFVIYGPVMMPHEMAYYGSNDLWGDDSKPHEMIIDACRILDNDPHNVDFTQYDKNGDDEIDIVYVFYAGYGEADGGGPNTIWPHSWEIAGETGIKEYFDGKLLNHYACSNELQAYSPNGDYPDGIGTFCHEFSHVMGLPDLYSTIGGGAFTPGSWTLMDSGSYNNNSRTPPHFSAFERGAFGWLDPEEIKQPGEYTLPPIGDENKAYILKTESTNEYFLLENRQLKDWDTHLPYHGMLVWHIDYNPIVWNNNTVNVNSAHQYVDIVEADGIPSNWTRDGDVFPGLYEKEEFSFNTIPSLQSWKGRSLEIDLNNIKEDADGQITFQASLYDPSSGIANIYHSEDSESRYFNLQGIEVPNPRKGELLIEIKGNSARKVVL